MMPQAKVDNKHLAKEEEVEEEQQETKGRQRPKRQRRQKKQNSRPKQQRETVCYIARHQYLPITWNSTFCVSYWIS